MTGTRFAAASIDDLDDVDVLLRGQRGRLARRADRNQPVDARGDLLVDETAQGIFVEQIPPKRRHERGDDPFETSPLPISQPHPETALRPRCIIP